MGLFINSQLQSLNLHKRLTELEKLSEISTGILALKSMVEKGDKLHDRKQALDNLSRILPLLNVTQQQYVLDEIFTPLMREDEEFAEQFGQVPRDGDETLELVEDGALSDYEMEFQLTLNRQAHYLDLKQFNREQVGYRKKEHKTQAKEEQKRLREERIQSKKELIYQRIDKHWHKIDLTNEPRNIAIHLKKFLFRYSSTIGNDHPYLSEARKILSEIR